MFSPPAGDFFEPVFSRISEGTSSLGTAFDFVVELF